MTENPSRRTGIAYSEKFRDHKTGDGHPESPSRMEAIRRALDAPSLEGKYVPLEPRSAERDEVLLLHTERHYEEVLGTRNRDSVYLDEDTVTSPGSADVALLAVGAVLTSVDAVLDGQVDNAFALVRPPGHHAKPDKAMGFCLFNNIAVAAQYALRNRGLKRVLIVNFDLHHGNGTQKAFYTSPEVLFISTHQWPYYPGTGGLKEIGKDAGRGFTLNVPLSGGTGDEECVQVFRKIVGPVGREFSPDLVLVSAGFDAHKKDPLGTLQLTPSGYAALTKEILDIAHDVCGGRAVFSLEGGYHLAGLEESVTRVVEVMAGESEGAKIQPASDVASSTIDSVRRTYGEFWKSLR